MLIHFNFNCLGGKSDFVTTDYNKSVSVVYKSYFRVIRKLDVNSKTDKEVASESGNIH